MSEIRRTLHETGFGGVYLGKVKGYLEKEDFRSPYSE